jgi:hypothetical protein
MLVSPSAAKSVGVNEWHEPDTPRPRAERELPATAEKRLLDARMLALTLPVTDGARVLVLGGGPEIVRAVGALGGLPAWMVTAAQLTRLGAQAAAAQVVGADPSLPFEDSSLDHVIADVRPHALAPYAGEFGRIVAPGGSIFATALSKLHAPKAPAAVMPGTMARALRGARFEQVAAFGIWPNLSGPRHLVPLGSTAALRWYIASSYLPLSAGAARMVRVLRHVGDRRLLHVVFPAFGFAARRTVAEPR